MPDIKKLITGFLIITTAASASVFMLSNAQSNASAVALAAQDAIASGTATLADQNAFVPTQNDITSAVTDEDPDVAAELNDPDNLTTNFTNAFLNSVADANPNGLGTPDADGNLDIASPDAQTVAAALGDSPAIEDFKLPNWNAQASAEKINVTNAATVQSYDVALNSVLNKDLVQSGAQSLIGQEDLDPSNFQAIEPAIDDTVSSTAAIPTPANLVSFQKSFVAMSVYEENMASLADMAQTDPVKASLIYEGEDAKYDQVLENFTTQFQNASAQGLFSYDNNAVAPVAVAATASATASAATPQNNDLLSLLQNYLGIQQAHAQFDGVDGVGPTPVIITAPLPIPTAPAAPVPVIDPASASLFAKFVEQTVDTIILQIVRNVLVAFIQQRVLKWIQNSGAPLFVQQFGQQLVNIAQAQAISSLANILPGYNASCPNIGKLLSQTTVNLGLTIPVSKQVPICSIPAVSAQQLTNFYKNFNIKLSANPGGNWNMYAQVLNPNGNYYGSLLQTMDYVNQNTAQAQANVQTQQIANQGFTGQTTCPGGANPNGTSLVCPDGSTPTTGLSCLPGWNAAPGVVGMCTNANGVLMAATSQPSCPGGAVPVNQSNNGLCPAQSGQPASEPTTITPGQTTKTVHDTALGGAINLTVNANSVVGILAAVGTSLLNTIVSAAATAAVKAGTAGLAGAVLGATNGSGGITSSGSNGGATITQPVVNTSTTPLPSQSPTTCSPHNPQCDNSVCTGDSLGDEISFYATGGDGITYTWSVGAPVGGSTGELVASPSTGSGATFSPYFELGSIPASTTLPSTLVVPVSVTGSDGVTDTCLAAISTQQ